MNDLLYKINLMCVNRGVILSRVDYVPLNTSFGNFSSSPANILPAVANVFYFCPTFSLYANTVAGTCVITILPITPQSDSGDAVQIINPGARELMEFSNLCCDSIVWDLGDWNGLLVVTGDVYKITTV